jgi:pilus assembly protein CpaF
MVLMAGFDLPLRAIREQMASAVDLLIHLHRFRDGSRRVVRVCEVEGMEGEVITLTDLYSFHPAAPGTAGFGTIRSTGIRPKFTEELAELGIELPGELFTPDGESSELRNAS